MPAATPRPDPEAEGEDAEAASDPGAGLASAAESVVNHPPISWVTGLFERRPFEEGSFEVEGLRLHYERHGEGARVLVFLHGLLLDNQLSRRLAADLADRGFQVVLLDLPGHGLSDKPRHASVHRMDSYARHVVALLDELGIEQAVVGGVSLGANVSLQVAVQAPERVRGLLIEMPVLEWAVPGAAVVFLPILLGVHYAAPLVRVMASLARRLPRTTVAPLDSVVAMISAEPEEIAAVLHGMLVGPITPTYEARHAITAPALVIGHRIDFIHPFTDADHLTRQLQHARLIEARSIFELRLAPDRLTAEIAEFLEDTWSDGSASQALQSA
jgi:pimeloyl-ACP methyl ester carboxylesterase